MVDNEMLEAMGQLMDSKLSAALEPIKADIADLKGDVSALKSDMAHMNHNIEPKLDKVLEMVSATNSRNRQLDLVESRVDDHDHRLFAVEESLRKAE